MGIVFEVRINEQGDTADQLDGRMFGEHELVRVHWPDASTTEEHVRINVVWNDADGTTFRRRLALVWFKHRGLVLHVRPALMKINVERIVSPHRPMAGLDLIPLTDPQWQMLEELALGERIGRARLIAVERHHVLRGLRTTPALVEDAPFPGVELEHDPDGSKARAAVAEWKTAAPKVLTALGRARLEAGRGPGTG